MSRTAQERIEKRLRKQKHKDLRKFIRANGGSVRTRLHSPAAERGATRKAVGE